MLRVIAVAAPEWVQGSKGEGVLNSRDPASLFNACRYAALQASNRSSAWSRSNWAPGRHAARRNVLLFESLDELPAFEALLLRERPNLLLIGAMSLCFPGAIALAAAARALLGNGVLIVLGGRHATETMYLSGGKFRSPEKVRHHPGSPSLLMHVGRIPEVFDAVISGDGEHLIAALGEAVEVILRCGRPLRDSFNELSNVVPGNWILTATDRGTLRSIVSEGRPVDYSGMPSPTRMFGVAGGFDVFGGRLTAHAFSDIGPGCAYDCGFCSERSSVTGGLRAVEGAPARLVRQFKEACAVIREDAPSQGASAFVEDSVLLGGSPRLLRTFADLLDRERPNIVFGAQFTIDQILARSGDIALLARLGMQYVFIGVETLSPDDIGGMSKDLGRARTPWLVRLRSALEVLARHQIRCGCAILFGLGESHASRIRLIEVLHNLRSELGMPNPISANWAVQHPLRGDDDGAGYDYVDWGTPPGPFLKYLRHFGEASVRYPLPRVGPPVLNEVREVVSCMNV